ncbi:WXG100 family type VII secretion target [Streptomyces sp. NPDC004111]|uniref:WXG100 family type VII secretion target n=1 Tax=Streptomyces sp. NPDC004111 TaxID=3364690 RepID=UPI0036A029BD
MSTPPAGYDHSNKTDGIIHVEYKRVDQAAEDMSLQTTRIRNLVQALNEELAGLHGAWQGADAATYSGLQAQWNQAAGQLSEVLTKHGQTLTDISALYRQHENRSASEWGNIRVGR